MPPRRIGEPAIGDFQLPGPEVIIIPGDGDQTYNVPEDLLRSASPFFDSALSGFWKEAQTRRIHLPADDSTTVGIYVSWLYSGSISVLRCSSSEYLDLARAYVFADKILDVKFQNATIDALAEKSTTYDSHSNRAYPQVSVINYVYEHTDEEAPIRKLFVDICMNYARPSLLANGRDLLPHAFVLGVASSCLAWRPKDSHLTRLNPKLYHSMG
ncbi:hypothetical protein BJY00DRAFT_61508 [Aspergillus carlsbadensis]|nr:hypothetical protein BJY00DRAFT_61508 [Aspergillus carlsbadensis]